MFVLLERPSTTSKSFAMLARKNGQYTRPIIGDIVDFRVEDFMPDEVLIGSGIATNLIGRLPDIAEVGQIGKFFSSTFQDIQVVSEQEAMNLFDTGHYLMLPDNPSSEYWEHVGAPWWEFAIVLDKYDGFIKAPVYPRLGEPKPEEADERIDEFEDNVGKIRVLAPSTLIQWAKTHMAESYLERLRRI
jgi:hypothetical protein